MNRLNSDVISAPKTTAMRERLSKLGAEPIKSAVREVTECLPGQIATL